MKSKRIENGELREGFFLPALGWRNITDGSILQPIDRGIYWSFAQVTSANGSALWFTDTSSIPTSPNIKVYGASIRCVREIKEVIRERQKLSFVFSCLQSDIVTKSVVCSLIIRSPVTTGRLRSTVAPKAFACPSLVLAAVLDLILVLVLSLFVA